MATRGMAIVPYERIAANCTPMANAAPTTAARICAMNRVRLGPMARNSARGLLSMSPADTASGHPIPGLTP